MKATLSASAALERLLAAAAAAVLFLLLNGYCSPRAGHGPSTGTPPSGLPGNTASGADE